MGILSLATSDKFINPGNDDHKTSQKKKQADMSYLLMEMY